jgi:hypothetical protein
LIEKIVERHKKTKKAKSGISNSVFGIFLNFLKTVATRNDIMVKDTKV